MNQIQKSISRSIFKIGIIFITLLLLDACNSEDPSKSKVNSQNRQQPPSTHKLSQETKNSDQTIPEKNSQVTIDPQVSDTNFVDADTSLMSVKEEEPKPEIIQLKITSMVTDRTPEDELTIVPISLGKVFTYTIVNSSVLDTIIHVYKFQGEEIARVPITVGKSPYWRTWSTKRLDKIWLGSWDVEIQSKDGQVLAKKSFTLVEKLPEESPAKPELTETL